MAVAPRAATPRTRRPAGAGAAATDAPPLLLVLALGLLLLAAGPRGAAAQGPPAGLWSYSVALAGGGVQLVWPAVPGTAPADYTLRGCGPASSPTDPPAACPDAAALAAPPTPALLCPGCPFLSATVPAAAASAAGPRLQVALSVGGAEVAAAPPVAPAADASAPFTFFASPAPHGDDTPTCGSWATPCATPAAALAAAAAAAPAGPAAVWLAPGVYSISTPLSFGGRPHALASLAGRAVTVLDGGPTPVGRLLEFRGGETPATVVAGLTLARGFSGLDSADPGGGCVLIDSASPTLADLALIGCSTCAPDFSTCNGDGGGIAVRNSANLMAGAVPLVVPRLLGVSISQSLALSGGGLHVFAAGLAFSGLSISDCAAILPGVGMGGGLAAFFAILLGGGLSISGCASSFTGGGLHGAYVFSVDPATLAPGSLPSVSITDNRAGTFAGGISCISNSVLALGPGAAINGNAAGYQGGGALVLAATLAVSGPASAMTGNVGPTGGGAIFLPSGTVSLTDVALTDNTAYGGAALFVSLAAGGQETSVASLDGCTLARNTATGLVGGALQVLSCTAVTVTDSVFEGNVAVKGGGANVNGEGAAPVPGAATTDPDPAAPAPVAFTRTTFRGNVAQYGGGLHVSLGGDVSLTDCVFEGNAARAAGGGAAVGEGGTLRAVRSTFSANGNFSCFTLPALGGGLAVGIDDFKPVASCAVPDAVPARAALADCAFDANLAAEAGGGVSVRAGRFAAVRTNITSNAASGGVASPRTTLFEAPGGLVNATASLAGVGRGGGLFVGGACAAGAGGAACPPAAARLENCSLAGNTAAGAGGGLFFDGSASNASTLTFVGGSLTGNAAPTGEAGGGGAGGGAVLASPGFNLSGAALAGNAARYGGGLFLSANLGSPDATPSRPATLEALAFDASNAAARGGDVFWVRAASAGAAFACPACLLGAETPLDGPALAPAGGGVGGRLATEALTAALAGAPPAEVQSNEPAPPFSVALLDFYGSLSSSDSGGSCDASTDTPGIALPGAGRAAPVLGGAATFERLTLTGGVGTTVPVSLSCTPRGASAAPPAGGLLPAGTLPLPDLSVAVPVGICPRGKEPPAPGAAFGVCTPCPFGRFSYGGGGGCSPCPEGGLCPGGAAGEDTPVKAYAGYWRSTNETGVPLFPCPITDACMGVSTAHPEWSGDAAGDGACVSGTRGPLCGLCSSDWYKFGGKCKPCSGIGAGKSMVAAAGVALILFLLAIFAKTWGGNDVGAGPMTKVKLATTHLQLLALLRDYDVAWPATTLQALGWADALNVGVSLTAPECLVKGWSFWHYYASSQALPAAAVLLCVGVYAAAGAVAARAGRSRATAAGAPPDAEEAVEGGEATVTPPPPTPPLSRAARIAAAVRERCWRNAFWLVTLLYPRAAQAALQLFSLTKLNTGTYLGADLGILVRPIPGPGGLCPGGVAPAASGLCPLTRTFKLMVPVGAAILAVIALGVPAFFFACLWRSRKRLGERDVLLRYSFLYCGYRVVYWESVDMVRKLAIAAIPVFVSPQPGGSVQALAGQAIMVGTAVVGLAVQPYAAPEDNWLLVGSSVVLWLVLLSGGALKWAVLSPFQMLVLSGVQMALSVAIAAVVAWLVVWRFGWTGLAKARAAKRAVGALCARLCGGGRWGGRGGGGADGRVAPAPPSPPTAGPAGFAPAKRAWFGGAGAGSKERLAGDAPPPPQPVAPLATAGGSGGSANIETALLAGSGGSGVSGAGSAGATPRASGLPPPPFGGTPRASGGGGAFPAASTTPRRY